MTRALAGWGNGLRTGILSFLCLKTLTGRLHSVLNFGFRQLTAGDSGDSVFLLFKLTLGIIKDRFGLCHHLAQNGQTRFSVGNRHTAERETSTRWPGC